METISRTRIAVGTASLKRYVTLIGYQAALYTIKAIIKLFQSLRIDEL